jgi:hypothetical protein
MRMPRSEQKRHISVGCHVHAAVPPRGPGTKLRTCSDSGWLSEGLEQNRIEAAGENEQGLSQKMEQDIGECEEGKLVSAATLETQCVPFD